MRSFSLALLGGLRLAGRLKLPERIVRISVIGGVDADLSEAEFAPGGGLTLVKVSLIGGLEMRVPATARVEALSIAIGGHSIEDGGGNPDPAGPRIRIYSFGLLGGVKVRRARYSDGPPE
jgi:hypothetical protein